MIKPAKKFTNNEDWITHNFQRLVDEYPGEFLVLMNGEPFIGKNAAQLFKKARLKYPKSIPTCMPIPRSKDFLSILCVR